MRGLPRATPVLMLAVALTGVTCAFPTDKSNDVFVVVSVPKQVVLQGQTLDVSAALWQRTGGGTDSVEIKNASFQWGTTNDARATVKDVGYGGAQVTGVTPGSVDLTVRAVSFEKAPTSYITLRVSKPLEIDSVRPTTAHFGELLTVYGVGVDSIFVASLAGVNLIEYPFSRVRDSTGLGQISFWVPPPARTDSLFYLGAGVFGFDTATTGVLKEDLFEPNDSTPALINLDLGSPWPGTALAPILFVNPALAFEPVEREKQGEDWFRFTTSDSTQAMTFFITYPSVGTDTAGTTTFLLDSLAYAVGAPGDPIEKFYSRDSADFVGSDFYTCKGSQFDPLQVDRESTTVALKTLPSHAIHIVTFFSKPQRYGLTVASGYFTADPRIKADRFEENDFCHFTDSLPGKPNPPSRLHVSTTAFSDTANIDNPFEIDWYRIEVPSLALGETVVFRLQARPFVVGRDSSDIDIYVLTVPGSTGSDVSEVGSSTATGSSESLALNLSAGSYYVAVVDYAGVATRYSMCIRKAPIVSPSCALIASPPAPVGAPKRAQQPSAAARAQATAPNRSLFVRPHRRP